MLRVVNIVFCARHQQHCFWQTDIRIPGRKNCLLSRSRAEAAKPAKHQTVWNSKLLWVRPVDKSKKPKPESGRDYCSWYRQWRNPSLFSSLSLSNPFFFSTPNVFDNSAAVKKVFSIFLGVGESISSTWECQEDSVELTSLEERHAPHSGKSSSCVKRQRLMLNSATWKKIVHGRSMTKTASRCLIHCDGPARNAAVTAGSETSACVNSGWASTSILNKTVSGRAWLTSGPWNKVRFMITGSAWNNNKLLLQNWTRVTRQYSPVPIWNRPAVSTNPWPCTRNNRKTNEGSHAYLPATSKNEPWHRDGTKLSLEFCSVNLCVSSFHQSFVPLVKTSVWSSPIRMCSFVSCWSSLIFDF